MNRHDEDVSQLLFLVYLVCLVCSCKQPAKSCRPLMSRKRHFVLSRKITLLIKKTKDTSNDSKKTFDESKKATFNTMLKFTNQARKTNTICYTQCVRSINCDESSNSIIKKFFLEKRLGPWPLPRWCGE